MPDGEVAYLVERRQPFHMEKPMGVDWQELDAVAAKAQTEGVWNAVALVSRCCGVIQALKQLQERGELGAPCHYYHSLFAGRRPSVTCAGACRGCSTRSSPAVAPCGDFGPHVMDLFQYLVGDVAEVECWTPPTACTASPLTTWRRSA